MFARAQGANTELNSHVTTATLTRLSGAELKEATAQSSNWRQSKVTGPNSQSRSIAFDRDGIEPGERRWRASPA